MILLLRISLLGCVVNGLTPPQCSRRPNSHELRAAARTSSRKAMGPNADRAIQLLRDAADDLEPREAYVFEPEGPVEGVAHFIGGAALGRFPKSRIRRCWRASRKVRRRGGGHALRPRPGPRRRRADVSDGVPRRGGAVARAPARGIGPARRRSAPKRLLLIACDDADAYEKLALLAPNNPASRTRPDSAGEARRRRGRRRW